MYRKLVPKKGKPGWMGFAEKAGISTGIEF